MDIKKHLLATDLYAFTTCFGYFKAGKARENAFFDLYFRKCAGGYIIAAGLEGVCGYIDSLRFDNDDIEILKELGVGDGDFYDYLMNFRFTGDISSVPEGTVVFSGEPVLTLSAPICEAVILESALLYHFNHQSAVASRAARLLSAAGGRKVYECAARRSEGAEAALLNARAAYIGGSSGTSLALAASRYKIPAVNIMPHSWVQMFECEYSAFTAYLKENPENAVLCADTYDTLGSGVPSFIEAIQDVLLPKGIKKVSLRLDSGDTDYLSKKTRAMLDAAGLYECEITVSSDLDSDKITRLVKNGAPVDSFAVGAGFTDGKSTLAGVYKLCAAEAGDRLDPKIKLSENYSKISLPGVKKTVRFYSSDGKAVADEVLLESESLPTGRHTLFHPEDTWKIKTLNNYSLRELLVPVYRKGERVYELPGLDIIKEYCESEKNTLVSDYARLESPAEYPVDYSESLWTLRRRMTGQRRSAFFLR